MAFMDASGAARSPPAPVLIDQERKFQMAVQDLERIENKIDRTIAGAVTVSDSVGGIMFQNMSEVLEFAKLMSVADVAVPKHLRGNPGACLSIVTQALEWRMSPFSVANKSYSVNDRLA